MSIKGPRIVDLGPKKAHILPSSFWNASVVSGVFFRFSKPL
jgi:hypothetical protein